MTSQLFGTVVLWIAFIAVAVVVCFWILSFIYQRSSKEVAFVRTGFGGEKVVISGGALVIPIIHQTTAVAMSGARLTVTCKQDQAVITRDRLRVDVTAEFFLRVTPTKDAVSVAAATLGSKTMQTEGLAGYFAGHLTGAIRSASAEFSLEAIQDERASFIERIEQHTSAALETSGVSLITVALRNIDQSDLKYFNSSNRFDAEGLSSLIGTIEERRKMRNDIEQGALVEIRKRNLQAEQEILTLEQQSSTARLEQERVIESNRVSQQADIEKEKSLRKSEAEITRIEREQLTSSAEINAKEQIEKARLDSEIALDESRISRERNLRSLEIDRAQQIAQREIAKDVALQDDRVKLYKSQTSADEARAKSVASSEAVVAAKQLAISQHQAQVNQVEATSEASVAVLLAEAQQIRAAATAEAERILNEAENILSEDARAGRLKAKLIDKLESIIRESMKPLEKIEGFKVVHVGGGNSNSQSPLDEVIGSAMRYRVQGPLIDEVLKDIGIEGGTTDILRSARDISSLDKSTTPKSGKGK